MEQWLEISYSIHQAVSALSLWMAQNVTLALEYNQEHNQAKAEKKILIPDTRFYYSLKSTHISCPHLSALLLVLFRYWKLVQFFFQVGYEIKLYIMLHHHLTFRHDDNETKDANQLKMSFQMFNLRKSNLAYRLQGYRSLFWSAAR